MFLTAREVQSIAEKFCFLAPNSNFSHYKDKKNIGTQIFFCPKTSLN